MIRTTSEDSYILPGNLLNTSKRSRRRMHWVLPIIVMVMYILVILTFFGIQEIQQKQIASFTAPVDKTRQELLIFLVVAMSVIIVITLLSLWHYTQIRSEAEHALSIEMAFRRAMEDSLSTGMRVLDLNGRVVYVNPAFCRMVGWNKDDLVGTEFPYPYWREGKFDEHQRLLDIVLSGNTPSSGIELEAVRQDGSTFTARLYVSPFKDVDGEHVGWMTSMTDITEPKRVREALTAAHERFMTVLESLDDAISVVFETSKGAELLFANRTYRRLFGAQAHGHKVLLNATQQHHITPTNEYYLPHINSWFEVSHRQLTWTDGRTVRLQVARDISERRDYEEKLQAQQEKVQLSSRLTTLGEMASTLAHELNQPLSAIMNYNHTVVALLRSEAPDEAQLLEILDKSNRQAERASRIISRIRAFVRRSEPQRQAVSIKNIIDHVMDLAFFESRKHSKIVQVNVPDNLPDIDADPILIEQVLLNLIKNGLEAMRNSQNSTLYVNVSQVGAYLQVDVVDSGEGIDDVERLYEPFYSTKDEGLGIGLNICRSIIESHRGRLWAERNPSGGTIFMFRLPCYTPNTLP